MASRPRIAAPSSITGLILAGGRGTRMGGADKGLQAFRGMPLVMHAMQRLSPQVTTLLISANRNLERYRELGVTVVCDDPPDFAGPLAGILAGLRAAPTEFVVTAPCDSPLLPTDLVARLAAGLQEQPDAQAAVAVTPQAGQWRVQPAFMMVPRTLADDLAHYLAAGQRKIQTWLARHTIAQVPFDDERPFYNINSLEELNEIERH
ncbi:molybdenum cofactor guanylyltransferase MobA [Pandoraea thiooxydans]|uniref:Molybdenum cofactor guanylyltransferase n=1 Tax=Pandoraea thiooxydans TaxID=445709 RepID=A0A0G3EUG6_9BURK|nr:molybdenum cofactor guanylyltransferase MobA [Pandoraea thiooxydans]AKJ68957.1 molybdenum cofactor guanylyltransferase MobA [Pandoraea thiooxydans]